MTTQHSFWHAFVRPLLPTLLGIGLAVAYGLVAHYAFGEWLWQGDVAAILTCSFLFLVPLALGALTISFSPAPKNRAFGMPFSCRGSLAPPLWSSCSCFNLSLWCV